MPLLVINHSPFGCAIGDSEAEDLVLEFHEWLTNDKIEGNESDPRDIFGEAFTHPLVHISEGNGGLWNCDQWMVEVDSIVVVNAARVLVKEGKIPLDHIKIMCEGVDCGLDKNGRMRVWPEGMCVFDDHLCRLLAP